MRPGNVGSLSVGVPGLDVGICRCPRNVGDPPTDTCTPVSATASVAARGARAGEQLITAGSDAAIRTPPTITAPEVGVKVNVGGRTIAAPGG
ncbi:hypothetical protein GWK47_012122 [Chionoecetes opilio]|uniref:Uncharacterized protein n=1 Tax=Chionoecetes opilio TaxID=41210 RepID=A0A8J4Y2E3_CHIOP|nr:hypothetical protein GWK47_012122 [Chionoecetes opilio]